MITVTVSTPDSLGLGLTTRLAQFKYVLASLIPDVPGDKSVYLETGEPVVNCDLIVDARPHPGHWSSSGIGVYAFDVQPVETAAGDHYPGYTVHYTTPSGTRRPRLVVFFDQTFVDLMQVNGHRFGPLASSGVVDYIYEMFETMKYQVEKFMEFKAREDLEEDQVY